jgi:hypothetical protein
MTQHQEKTPSMDYTDLQEYFSDVFEIHLNPWSGAITFGLRATKQSDDHKMTLRVRMPLQQAKALAVLLLGNIRKYEHQSGTDVDLPKQVLKALEIPPEDWERFKGA